jgi:selenocysteine lyase/cysteine desulfurase
VLQDQKERFEIDPGLAYFNCSYMAPMLRTVHAAALDAVARTAQPWTISSRDFFEPAERARQLIARLLGASADEIAIVPSVSYGIGVAAANLVLKRGQTVLVLAEEFPSNVYPWRVAVARYGAELVTVPRPADGDWTSAVLAHIDDRVGLAALPNCHWTDGARLDLVRIGAALRSVGAALVLDLMQSLGAHPFDVRQVKPDFVACASYK